MRPSSLISALLLLKAATASWPSGWDPLDIAKRELAPLLPRQDNNDNNNNNNDNNNNNNNDNNGNNNQASSSSQAPAASSSAPPDKRDGNGNGNGNDNKKNKNKNQKTTSKYQTTKTFDARLPAGGVSMITPAAILGPQYYKIGNDHVTQFVTFAWNFTSLSVTPSAVDVVASCALNSQTYPIAMNYSIAGKTQSVIWDTGAYQKTASSPLLIATYTLMIYDSDSAPTEIPRAGYLGLFDQLTFGMYTPSPPTPLSEFVCATCNGAGSLEAHTLSFLFGMVVVTVLSFGWFTGVAGLW